MPDEPIPQEDIPAEPLPPEEQIAMAGDLEPGKTGFVAIDEAGTPGGVAEHARKQLGTPAFPVRTNTTTPPDPLTTIAGAPIMDAGMNPSPQLNKYNSPAYTRYNPESPVAPVEQPPA